MHEIQSVDFGSAPKSPLDFLAAVPPTKAGRCEHFVQFYEQDAFLIDSVAQFFEAGLRDGDTAVVIATPEHRAALAQRLRENGVPTKRYKALDAAETLAKFMVAGIPDERLFQAVIGKLVAQLTRRKAGLRAFGEMVALLWAEGNGKAALRLEELWNQLSKSHRFALFCAYPMAGFRGSANGEPFLHICREHTHVIPCESYSAQTPPERLRSISVLQQKAASLDAEIETRKQAEIDAHTEQAKADLAVAIAGLGVWEIDLVTHALSASDQCRTHLGLKPGEPLTLARTMERVHPEDKPAVEAMLAKARSGGTDYSIECRVAGLDEEVRWIKTTGRSHRNGSHRVTGVTMDVTETKQASAILEQTVLERTERLEEIIRELEGFSYSISHDMRSPLRAMHGYAKALLDDYGGSLDQKGITYLQRIQRASNRLDMLIRDVLAYSKVAKGEVEIKDVPLGPLVADILDQRIEFAAMQHCIVVDGPLHSVRGHEAYLTQCFTNLIGNALKFVPADELPNVRIWSQAVGGEVQVFVSDKGIGIHPDHHGRIFQMFGRVHPQKLYEGTGVGLAIVKKAVARMGGRAGFQSTPGKGSDFWFVLPCDSHSC